VHRQPLLVHFNAGLHDLRTIFHDGVENVVPVGHYTDNLRTLVRNMRARTRAKLIWASTTPVIDKAAHEAHAESRDFGRYNADVVRYNQAAAEVMRELNVPVNDLYTIVEEQGADSIQSGDGVHYNDEGRRILGTAVARAIAAACC
jgi:lysophospholipase L1-like esterase